MNAAIGASGNALTLTNPWSMVPALGHLEAYISAVNRMPMLTLEEEQAAARKLRADNDVEAAGPEGLWILDDQLRIRLRGSGEPRLVNGELRVPVAVPGIVSEEMTW